MSSACKSNLFTPQFPPWKMKITDARTLSVAESWARPRGLPQCQCCVSRTGTGGTRAGQHMAFWVRPALLLAADQHLNTGLWPTGKAELLYSRCKGTPQSLQCFRTSHCFSSHQQESHQLRVHSEKRSKPCGHEVDSSHCFLPCTSRKGVWW